jgi:hypothetical protein
VTTIQKTFTMRWSCSGLLKKEEPIFHYSEMNGYFAVNEGLMMIIEGTNLKTTLKLL